MIERGEIVDAKTIMLLYHAKLKALIYALRFAIAPRHSMRPPRRSRVETGSDRSHG